METLKKQIVFLDAENHRARLNVEITERNGYPEFTMSGQFMGSHGQCIDRIKPANDDQKELVRLWETYHLKDVSAVPNFREHLEEVLAGIQHIEDTRPTKKQDEEEAMLEMMEQEGIDEERLEAVRAYIYLMGSDDLSDFEEAYCGEYRDDEEFAQETAWSIGAVDNDAQWPNNCIDWEQAARQLMQDYSEHEGYYFRNI